MEDVLESAEYIAGRARHVSVSAAGVDLAAERVLAAGNEPFALSTWLGEELNPSVANEATLEWIFVVDTLNFCFWAEEGQPLFACQYRGRERTGYWSLCACINRALDENIPITSARYMADVTLEQLQHVFRSSSAAPVPLLAERVRVLNEAGRVLLSEFDGKFQNVLHRAQGSALAVVALMAEHFASYRDACVYQGRPVAFLKRAQILVADVWAAFEGVSWGAFADIDRITMFADYRVPQILAHLGLLQYSAELMEQLMRDPHLEPGCELEAEIRGVSIWAVELLRRRLDSRFNSIQLDFFLWTLAKQKSHEMGHVPFHKTRSCFY